jgi:hypothetical protein
LLLLRLVGGGEVCAKTKVIEDVIGTRRRRTNTEETPKIDIDIFLLCIEKHDGFDAYKVLR